MHRQAIPFHDLVVDVSWTIGSHQVSILDSHVVVNRKVGGYGEDDHEYHDLMSIIPQPASQTELHLERLLVLVISWSLTVSVVSHSLLVKVLLRIHP